MKLSVPTNEVGATPFALIEGNMADIKQDFESLIRTLRELFHHERNYPEAEILGNAQAKIEQIGYDNWNGGTDIYGISLEVPTNVYATFEEHLKTIEDANQ